jgi:hypothetical protein
MDEDPVSFVEDDIRIQLRRQAEDLQQIPVVTKEMATQYMNLIRALIATKNNQ